MSNTLPTLLTAHDVASWLGMPTRRVVRLARAGDIPSLTLPDGEIAFDAAELTAWIHAPSQPLMRSPLSRFQTPTAPRRTSRFFRVRLLFRSPCRADHSAYFGAASFISPILSAVDACQTKQFLHRCQRNSQHENEISVHGIVENTVASNSCFRDGATSRRMALRRHGSK